MTSEILPAKHGLLGPESQQILASPIRRWGPGQMS